MKEGPKKKKTNTAKGVLGFLSSQGAEFFGTLDTKKDGAAQVAGSIEERRAPVETPPGLGGV